MSDSKKCLDCLLKTDGITKNDTVTLLNNSKKYKNTKSQMRSLCKTLCMQSSKYKPEKMVETIDLYINRPDKLDRILYSEISNYIFGLTSANRGTFSTNVECLLLYVLDEKNSVKEDTRKIVIKIYDHVQLATHQIENGRNMFGDAIVEAKSRLHDEIKGIEKEHITILGIFASIVLAFVGGITFTTSVLENIDKVSVFRLIFTVDVIGAVLVNVIYLLISFILKINDKDKESDRKFIKIANWVLLGIATLILIAWFINIMDLQEYFSKFFIWTSK